jgi:hypothetical protein
MATLRVVLYAEGAGETRGAVSLLPAPGEVLGEEWLGPGHLLIRRAIARSLESMLPRQAKQLLAGWLAQADEAGHEAKLRIAATCDLDRLKAACRSFEELLRDLADRRG